MPRTISDNGIQFTKAWELFSATPYYATADEKARGILTWGYGHTGSAKDAPKSAITPGQGLLLLNNDMAWAVAAVDAVAHPSLTQAQFDAVVDLVFNAGAGVIGSGTGTGQALRRGDTVTLRAKLALFINQNGRPLLGLRRRTAGRLALFDGKSAAEAEKIGRAVK
jgi:lysozyme